MSTVDELLGDLMKPVEIVLGSDLEKLRRVDHLKRASLWHQIRSSEEAFKNELASRLSAEDRASITSEFTLAKVLLAAAARANEEATPIVQHFSQQELDLVSEFERYNSFDLLSIDEISDRMARRKDVYDVAMRFYREQYSKLDAILDSPVLKDLKIAFNKRYQSRLDKVVKAVQAYVEKNGADGFVGDVEEHALGRVGAKAEQRVTADLRETTRAAAEANGPVRTSVRKSRSRINTRLMIRYLTLALGLLSLLAYVLGFQLFPWLESRSAQARQYVLIVQDLPSDKGTVQVSPLPDADGRYKAGTRVSLEARPTTGATFVQWSGDAQGTIPSVVVTIDQDTNVVAEFR